MPTTVNGRSLGVARNGVFTDANTDPIPGGKLWPESALTWNAMRAAYVAAGGHPDDFMPAGPVSSARPLSAQQHFWDAHARDPSQPVAAVPGTSNHGWGIAVDVKTRAAAAWIMRNGARYGWNHNEGARVGEWWHMGYEGATAATLRKLKRDPLAGFTASEKRWIRELDELRRLDRDLPRRRVLVRVMTEQRVRIWRAAEKSGWTRARRRRYEALRRRTTPTRKASA